MDDAAFKFLDLNPDEYAFEGSVVGHVHKHGDIHQIRIRADDPIDMR